MPFLMNWKGRIPGGTVSDAQVMHADIFATLLDAAHIPLSKMNGKNPMRGLSLMPHMASAGTQTLPERTMIFELWGNVGLRKGDHKLWADTGRDFSPDWSALVAQLKKTDLALFDLSEDAGEATNLRTELPEIYASLKAELIEHWGSTLNIPSKNIQNNDQRRSFRIREAQNSRCSATGKTLQVSRPEQRWHCHPEGVYR